MKAEVFKASAFLVVVLIAMMDMTPSDFSVMHNAPHASQIQQLINRVSRFAPHDGNFSLLDGRIHIVKSSHSQTEKTFTLAQPSLCLVPQGAKQVSLGSEGFEYDASKMVLYAAEVPLKVTVTKASADKPYYCVVIPIDGKALNRQVLKVFSQGVPAAARTRAVYVGASGAQYVSAINRMFDVITQQDNTALLVPHIIDEILLRLLCSPVGAEVAQIGVVNSKIERISVAVSFIKKHYARPLKVEALAREAGMSLSSFHTHFKQVTQLTPGQFQKMLRLQHAREQVRQGISDVTRIAFDVGYASASQFSREYSREFGIAPSKDSL